MSHEVEAGGTATERETMGGASKVPLVSVIIPVRNDPTNLASCLEALQTSDYPASEIIVVDDGSTDDTPEVARRYGVKLLRLENSSGPAAARNHGAHHARFPYLFFIDADVCVKPDTLRRSTETFLRDPSVDALFGSYDDTPGAPNVISQYRNLMHHYVHQTSNEEAFTFWGGCGAIKREVFLEVGGFDPSYGNASIEDIELGGRLRRAGHRIRIVKDLQAKHMKRWTLWPMICCDILNRGIPWTVLLLKQGGLPDDMNIKNSQRLSVVFAYGFLAALGLAAWSNPLWLLPPPVVLGAVALIDRWTEKRTISHLARFVILGVALAAAFFFYTSAGPVSERFALLLGTGFLGGIVLLNLRFYAFFSRVKSPLFVLLVLPLHVLYFLYSGLALALGLAWYAWHRA